jgi:hypothetical protein
MTKDGVRSFRSLEIAPSCLFVRQTSYRTIAETDWALFVREFFTPATTATNYFVRSIGIALIGNSAAGFYPNLGSFSQPHGPS